MAGSVLLPKPCLMRLPHYYRRLLQAMHEGQSIISSDELGEEAGVPAAQARKDLSYLGEFGRPGVGYDVYELAAHLEKVLGLNEPKKTILIGVGNLGRALASYPGFARYRLQIIAAFDVDPSKIGQRIGSIPVLPLEELETFVRQNDVRMAILAVPAPQAQSITDRLAGAGIRLIWNFAPVSLRVPEGVKVFNEDLAARLATLSFYLVQHSS